MNGYRCIGALAFLLGGAAMANDDQPAFSAGNRFDQRSGEAIYRSICQGCHMPDGRGASGAGTYPALANNPRTASAPYVIVTVLGGRRDMPSFARGLDDAQIAAVATFVRTRFGNAYPEPVTAAQVAALRASK
jgi:mono/diheme cytochrome c family protein